MIASASSSSAHFTVAARQLVKGVQAIKHRAPPLRMVHHKQLRLLGCTSIAFGVRESAQYVFCSEYQDIIELYLGSTTDF
jgi:hypothetical protein